MRNVIQICSIYSSIHLFHKPVRAQDLQPNEVEMTMMPTALCFAFLVYVITQPSQGLCSQAVWKAGYLLKYLFFYEGESRVHCVMYNKITEEGDVEEQEGGKDNTVK